MHPDYPSFPRENHSNRAVKEDGKDQNLDAARVSDRIGNGGRIIGREKGGIIIGWSEEWSELGRGFGTRRREGSRLSSLGTGPRLRAAYYVADGKLMTRN